jgi:hypothetical protein
LADALQEVQRLKSNSDSDKNGSSEKLTLLLNDLRDERDKVGLPSSFYYIFIRRFSQSAFRFCCHSDWLDELYY